MAKMMDRVQRQVMKARVAVPEFGAFRDSLTGLLSFDQEKLANFDLLKATGHGSCVILVSFDSEHNQPNLRTTTSSFSWTLLAQEHDHAPDSWEDLPLAAKEELMSVVEQAS